MSDIEIPWGDTQGTQRAIENVARGLHRDVFNSPRVRLPSSMVCTNQRDIVIGSPSQIFSAAS